MIAISLVLFASAAAAVTDVRSRRIPNLLVGGLLLGGLAIRVFSGFPSLGYAVALGAVVFLLGTALFSLRLIGGGDVKFLAAASVALQPLDAVTFILATLVAGGIVAVCYSIARGHFAATMANVRDLSIPLLYGVRPSLKGTTSGSMPYALALFAGAAFLALSKAPVFHMRLPL